MTNQKQPENLPRISLGTLNIWLLALLGSNHLVDKWWATPNKAFELDTPANVYSQYPEHVVNYIMRQLDTSGS
jgi:hypothetical protein